MPSITVRNIDENLKQRLQHQAAKHGCSMEEEVRRILAAALPQHGDEAKRNVPDAPTEGLGTAIHNLFKPVGLTDEEFELFSRNIEELRHPSRGNPQQVEGSQSSQ